MVPWFMGFADWNDSYRSRDRKKKHEVDRIQDLERKYNMQQEQINKLSQQGASQQQQQPDPALDGTIPSSMPKSSVGSTGVPADDALLARYPMDDITQRENCELHVKCMNISVKVAVGFALPPVPDGTYHCSPIPDGYAVVGVDEVV